MFEFPDWSDLGTTVSTRTQDTWDYHLMELERFRRYFDGDVFQEKVPVEHGSDEDAPLLYPVGINLVRMLTLAQTDAVFGEHEDGQLPVIFGVRQDQRIEDADKAAIDLANSILDASNGPALLWEHELDRNAYSGGAIKILPSLKTPGHILWRRVPCYSFFPIWDPDDPDTLLEAFMVVYMSAEQAYAKYRFTAAGEYVKRIEHWTQFSYENYLDGIKLNDYSGANPWGVIPFVYTPRFRSTNWWGESLTKDLMTVQDELNARVADIGEAINYNAHPVRWGLNMPRNFSAKNFPIGPNAMWDLGRALGSNPKPEVGILEAKTAVSPQAFEHIKWLYDWGRTSVFAPPIAFGEDNGGGQRSGVTLEIRMWPLIKAVRRSRAYLYTGLKQALHISGLMLEQKRFPDVPARAVKALIDGRIVPHFHEVLPRDHQAAVDEVVKLLSTTPPSISLETAMSVLGRGSGEVQRIREMLDDEELFDKPNPQAERDLELKRMTLSAKASSSEAPKGKPDD